MRTAHARPASSGDEAALLVVLLPLLLQTAFGWSAVRSGVFVPACLAGNLGMGVAPAPLLKAGT